MHNSGDMFAASQQINEGMKEYREKLRKKFQGRVYAGYQCRAVRQRAEELACFQTDRVLEILKLFDIAAFEIRAQCGIGRLGRVSPALTHVFWQTDAGDLLLSQGTERPVRKELVINEELLRRVKGTGISIAWDLIQKEAPTDLEERAVEAISHFAHGIASTAAQDRLIHSLTAVESLLLRNTNEPIMGKLGQRLAILTKPSLELRKQAVCDFNEGYRLRSAFVHHGQMPDDVQIANRLLILCRDAVNCVMFATREFETKDALINRLDDQLLAP